MEDNNKKIKWNKSKIANNTLIATLTIVISFIIIFCLWTVAYPVIKNGFSSSSDGINYNSNSKYMARIEEALNKLKDKYIDFDSLNMDELIDGAISGLLEATGDPYTHYMSDEEFNELLTEGTEKFSGVGLHLTYDKDSDGILVVSVMPDSPALEAGIKPGDIIVAVDGTSVNMDNYQECVDNMRGEEGTTVKLSISRNNENFDKDVVRKSITTSNVESDILDGNIGYLKILSFDNSIYEQFKTEYDKLMAKNITGLVIDVRNNPGGLVPETIKILDLLLPKGDVLKLVYKDGSEKVYKCTDDNQINIPLAVIGNSRSASASEILASAIKDSGKGVLVGDKTYGKGIVQEVENLGNRGALSITVAKYYTMSGVEIHKNGIEPNIAVSLPDELKNETVVDRQKDTQLQKAVEYINSKK